MITDIAEGIVDRRRRELSDGKIAGPTHAWQVDGADRSISVELGYGAIDVVMHSDRCKLRA